jgi:hypothetical protein
MGLFDVAIFALWMSPEEQGEMLETGFCQPYRPREGAPFSVETTSFI